MTSKNRVPDQSMMLFSSIVELLDGLRRFFRNARVEGYTFVGTDCSFEFAVRRTRNGLFLLTSGSQEIDTASREEIVRAVWEGVRAFLDRYQDELDRTDIVADDLKCALAEFRVSFNLRESGEAHRGD
ncbi:MAG: hypothetical protein ACR2MC_13730 [Actinomycetota bacterium]